MVSTRSMATKADPSGDAENKTLSLRKKPVRRATAKAVATQQPPPQPKRTSTQSSRASEKAAIDPITILTKSAIRTTRATRKTQDDPPPSLETAPAKSLRAGRKAVASPLSPKKITQVTKTNELFCEADDSKKASTANAKPKRPLRAAASKSSEQDTETAEKATTRRGRPRKISIKNTKIQIVHEDAEQDTIVVNSQRVKEPKESETQREPETRLFPDDPVVEAPYQSLVGLEEEPKSASRKPRKLQNKILVAKDVASELSDDELTRHASTTKAPSRLTVESDDEICGPATPMRRGHSPVKLSVTPALIPGACPLQTPARQLLLGACRATPQTQKLPIRAPGAASPQRPMTIARGMSKPMVFRPLLGLENAEPSPSKLSHIHETHQEDDETPANIAEDDQALHAGSLDPQSTQSDSEDELNRDPEANSEDDEHLLDAPVDNLNEVDYEDEDESSSTSDDEEAESDLELDPDEESLLQPQLSNEALQSSPAPTTPGSVNMHDADIESSPAPSTPGSVVVHAIAEGETPTQAQHVPVARLSFLAETCLPEFDDDEVEEHGTPDGSRMSFNTVNARMLQTPHMRAFRESYVPIAYDETTTASQSDTVTGASASCIDPALLFDIGDAMDLAQEADALACVAPDRVSPSLAAQAETMEPAVAFYGRRSIRMNDSDNSRLSLLDESILIQPADYDESAPISLASSAAHQVTIPDVEEDHASKHVAHAMQPPSSERVVNSSQHLDLSETIQSGDDQIDIFEKHSKVPQVPEGHSSRNAKRSCPATPSVPRYAQPTVSSESRSRRKSMPMPQPATPLSMTRRPFTAETVIKPVTSEAFAELWAAKLKQPGSRRKSSLRNVDSLFSARESSPKPESARTPEATRSGLRPRQARTSSATPSRTTSAINVEAATPDLAPSVAKARKHTPLAKKVHLKEPQPRPLRTPMKTPLKAPGATPASFPMTPHPSQPLSAVTALVEIFTLDGSSASAPFIALLQRLGARTTKVWSDRVTHVVFKDGSPSILQKVRLSNKDHATPGSSKQIFCVNSRWVTDCDKEGRRMDEKSDEYAVDVDEIGTKSKAASRHRRRKSMEPASLKNIDGNVVATDSAGSVKPRRPSVSRKSMARESLASTFWGTPGMSPIKGGASAQQWGMSPSEQENSNVDESFWSGSEIVTPVLPGYMNRQQELEMLQRTAPVNRMKKLRLKDADEGRRMTITDGRD